MTKRTRHQPTGARPLRTATLAMLAVAGCAGRAPAPPSATPPTTASTPPPEPVRADVVVPRAPATATAAPTTIRLDNGVTATIATAGPGRAATLQFGLAAGAAFVASGAAELAAHVLVDGADPSQGRGALRQEIARLGGTVEVQLGPLTTWLDVRVPGPRWREALRALRTALESPSWSRNQIERIREQVVAAREAELRSTPERAMARALMLGERSGAAYVLSLLDRDPSQVAMFVSRVCQPDRAVLAIEVPAPAAQAAAELAANGSVAFASWTPPPPAPGPVSLLDRKFESGLYWAPARATADAKAPCRVALVAVLPNATATNAADALLLQSCFSLDGAGGRLEQLQRERGLGHVRWQGDIVLTPDAAAMVLTTAVDAAQVAPLWDVARAARQSLLDVPPSDSELAIASQRVPLTARLVAMDDGSRVRTGMMFALQGTSFDAIDRRLEAIQRAPVLDFVPTATKLLAQPFAMVVIGGTVPAGLTAVDTIELLPVGDTAGAGEAPVLPTPAKPQPWLALACDAVGGTDALRRLDGWRAEANVVHGQAPPMREKTTSSRNGDLQRTRTVLGQDVVTTLAGASWSESVDGTVLTLDAREVAVLRRDQQRHPLALLAAGARGELSFRTVAQRDAGDRRVVVLEVLGGGFDRLRVHVDVQSHLVRVVESWETLPDGAVVHLHETWQDYRAAGVMRAPFRRVLSQDDGQNRVETVFTAWTPMLRTE
jgi:hypothetical protein